MVASQLSQVENGKREPKISLLTAVAQALGVSLADLLTGGAPDHRAALEIELDRAQRGPVFATLGLPHVRPGKSMPTAALEAMVGLHREIERREKEAAATPEETRRAVAEQRAEMRQKDNYLPELEKVADDLLRACDRGKGGALTHRTVAIMAQKLGFTLIHVDDLPHSTRSVTDIANGRIYLPPASIPGGHGLRSLALQALANRLLEHPQPTSYAEFLKQRLETNYFASACLMPRTPALEYLRAAKAEKNLAVEDFRDAFGVTQETAALRLTNLATSHLDLRTHFLRTGDDGTLYKAYENDGLPLPRDINGAIEGQLVCRKWAARTAYERATRTTEFHQYTDTPSGTFWCTAQTSSGQTGEFSITLGVPFADAKWFRGRETLRRVKSECPDESCCRRPPDDLYTRWSDQAWPSAKTHAHILSPLPGGSYPGVDDTEVYEFLERHAVDPSS